VSTLYAVELLPNCCLQTLPPIVLTPVQLPAHVSSWRALLEDPLLPWIFVHLQPYTGSYAPALFNPELYATCRCVSVPISVN
jgi:hypothetical protein